MNIQDAYNKWANQYDSDVNKTRDLEQLALQEVLGRIPFETVLEIGCGTGKNSGWLAGKALRLTAVDFSVEMLNKARQEHTNPKINFQQADITHPWQFIRHPYDLVCFSLVLEHIEKLEPVFREAARAVHAGGWLYLGELHPFRQYAGAQARFESSSGIQKVTAYTHHISDFIRAAKAAGFIVKDLDEFFDSADRLELPRILTLLFQKQ